MEPTRPFFFLGILGQLSFCVYAVPTTNKSNVHLFVFHKNEREILSDWLSYHLKIFNHSHLHVIDNNSTIPEVVQTLDSVESAGVRVYRNGAPLIEQEQALSRIILDVINSDSTIDWIVPLDTDEFVVAKVTDGVFTSDPDQIHTEFDNLRNDGHKKKFEGIEAILCNHEESTYVSPRRVLDAVYFEYSTPVDCLSKTLFPAQGFVSTGMGNHNGKVKADSLCSGSHVSYHCGDNGCFDVSNLALVHYGGRALTWTSYKAKIFRGYDAWGFTPTSSCKTFGGHYCHAVHTLQKDGEEETKARYEQTRCDLGNITKSLFMANQVLDVGSTLSVDFRNTSS